MTNTLDTASADTLSPASFPLGGRVGFFGRTLRDYAEIFDFEAEDLVGRRVLDVAAGPSSFTVEATLAGAEGVALDPLYRLTLHGLRDRFRRDYDAVCAWVRDHETRYAKREERETLFARRRAAADRFLGDFVAGRAAGRYRAEALPHLPFADGAFDRVFCGHFLFLYGHRFDAAFHLAACRELCRVAREEVRVYPLSGFDGAPLSFLDPLRFQLAAFGIESVAERLQSPMLRGADERLILFPQRQ